MVNTNGLNIEFFLKVISVINEIWFDFFKIFCNGWIFQCKSIMQVFWQSFKKKAFKDVFISGLSTMLPVVEKYEWTSSIFDKVTGGQQ